MSDEVEDDGTDEYVPYSINMADGNIFVPDIDALTASLTEIGFEPLLFQAKDGQFYVGHVTIKGKQVVGKWTAFDSIAVARDTSQFSVVNKKIN